MPLRTIGILIFAVIFSAILISSCKKDKTITTTPDKTDTVVTPTPTTATEMQLIADSVYLFSREIYYWDSLRIMSTYASFNPRQYANTDDLTTAKNTLAAIRNYAYYDKIKQYSYATTYEESSTSSATQKITDYGFFVKDAWKSRTIASTRLISDFAGWYITYVYKNSDAGKKGMERGMKILKINNTTLDNTTVNGYNNSVDLLNNILIDQTVNITSMQLLKTSGDTLTLGSVANSSFEPNSILYTNVITTGNGNKVGYFVYNFFDKYSDTKTDLDNAFQSFKNAGINNIILDLRYNHGGYTTTQDYLTNYVAPTSANGSLMYKFYFNKDLQNGNYTVLQTRYPKNEYSFALTNPDNIINFNTTNSLNTPKVFVIVGYETASSSELLINNLKPKLGSNIILIGDDNTYGKPVGFFPIDLFKKVTFWTVSFMTRNSNSDSVSYNGFKPDYAIYDGVDKSWGDANEDCLKAALNLIDGKNVSSLANTTGTIGRSVLPLSGLRRKAPFLHDNMILDRR